MDILITAFEHMTEPRTSFTLIVLLLTCIILLAIRVRYWRKRAMQNRRSGDRLRNEKNDINRRYGALMRDHQKLTERAKNHRLNANDVHETARKLNLARKSNILLQCELDELRRQADSSKQRFCENELEAG